MWFQHSLHCSWFWSSPSTFTVFCYKTRVSPPLGPPPHKTVVRVLLLFLFWVGGEVGSKRRERRGEKGKSGTGEKKIINIWRNIFFFGELDYSFFFIFWFGNENNAHRRAPTPWNSISYLFIGVGGVDREREKERRKNKGRDLKAKRKGKKK